MNSYPDPSELLGKQVVVVANLKASNFRGVKSFGMLLCATSGDNVSVLSPRDNVELGVRISPEGAVLGEKAKIVNSKKFKNVLKKAKLSLVGGALHGDSVTLLIEGTETTLVANDKVDDEAVVR